MSIAPTPRTAVALARWSVMWKRKGKLFERRFGTDLVSAEELRDLLVSKGVRNATLRCTNVGFPPPAKYHPRYVWVEKKGRRRQVYRVPMRKVNAAGLFWCPYCRRFRKFREGQDRLHGRRRPYLACPWCRVRHTNHHVSQHNPLANDWAWRYPYNYKSPKVKR